MECVGGGVDYNSGPYSGHFDVGVTRASFNVSINTDIIFEDNETFYLDINLPSLPRSVTVSDPGQTTVIIADDDGKEQEYHCTREQRF